MKKKLVALLLAATMVLGLVGCGGEITNQQAGETNNQPAVST